MNMQASYLYPESESIVQYRQKLELASIGFSFKINQNLIILIVYFRLIIFYELK